MRHHAPGTRDMDSTFDAWTGKNHTLTTS
jgi:hypothetical protein